MKRIMPIWMIPLPEQQVSKVIAPIINEERGLTMREIVNYGTHRTLMPCKREFDSWQHTVNVLVREGILQYSKMTDRYSLSPEIDAKKFKEVLNGG